MIVQPSPQAVRRLRSLQQFGLESDFAHHSISMPSANAWKNWTPPLALDEAERQRVFDRVTGDFMPTSNSMPTDLEDPFCYQLYRTMLEIIERKCALLDFRLPKRLCLGTMHSKTLNAHAFEIDQDNDECLVVISRQIIPFCHLFGGFLANVIASQLSKHNGDDEAFSVARPPTQEECDLLYRLVGNLISEIGFSYDEEGDLRSLVVDNAFRMRPRIHVEGMEALLRAVVTDAMQYFMLSHELGHLIIARFTEEEARPREMTPDLQNAQFRRYREEHECDLIGNTLASHAMAEVYGQLPVPARYSIGLTAGPIFLSCLQLAERASHMTRTGEALPERVPVFGKGATRPDDASTHPPTVVRREYLLHRIRIQLSSQTDVSPQVFDVSRWLGRYLEQAWMLIRERFQESYRQTHAHLPR